MALGTSIVMAQIVCIGTVLPLAFSAADMTTQEIVGSVVGVLLACAGFAMSSRAGLLRDAGDEAGGRARGSRASTTTTAAVDVEDPVKGASRSTFVESMAWCVAGGVLSSMLQFSFVFGGGLVDDAEERGLPKRHPRRCGCCVPVQLCAMSSMLPGCSRRTTRGVWSTTARARRGDALIAVAFTAHIHLYGLGAARRFVRGCVRVAARDVFDRFHRAGVVAGAGGVDGREFGAGWRTGRRWVCWRRPPQLSIDGHIITVLGNFH